MQNNIQIDLVYAKLKIANRKQLITVLSDKIAQNVHYPKISLYAQLIENEKQENAAIGEGVALPHVKLRGLQKCFVTLATLEKPIQYDAPDGYPVDMVCLLLSPHDDGPIHLRGLSRLSRMFKNTELVSKIRECKDTDAIRSILMDPEGWLLAA